MVFSSLIFLFQFLPTALLIYFISPQSLRNVVLLVASLIFYAWGEPIYIFLMLFSTVFDYVNGILIHHFRHQAYGAKIVFLISLLGNLGILGFYKYAGFAVENINRWFDLNLQAIDLPLPIGLSFYTFQTLSYVIDVYRGKVQPQRNIIAFGTYVTLFPQLVAGPIVKYGDIASQLVSRNVTLNGFGKGAKLFIRGLAKKVLLANNLGLLWISVKSTPVGEVSVLGAWLGIIAFTLQIYFDFSGYSDMARGLAKMLGFHMKINFNYPYISRSVTEFWRRWHISLGAWFREYVYIPLGGNQSEASKQFRNLLIVWFLTGLWHGASWNFVIWGLFFGLLVTIEKMFLLKWLQCVARPIAHLYLLLTVVIGWVFFEFEHMDALWSFIGRMFGWATKEWVNNQALYDLSVYGFILLISALCATPLPRKWLLRVNFKHRLLGGFAIPVLYVTALILSTAYLVAQTYNPFLYFRF